MKPVNLSEKLLLINEMMGTSGNGYRADLNLIMATCQRLFGPDILIFNHVDHGWMLYDITLECLTPLEGNQNKTGQLPSVLVESPEPVCYMVEDIAESPFSTTDSIHLNEKMISYVGYCIKSGEKVIAGLSMYYARKLNFSDDDRCLLGILAAWSGNTETVESVKQTAVEKDKFFSLIAHDLKSPFTGFLGLSYLLAEENARMSPDELTEIALTLRKSASNIYSLLDNLLEWSRLQRGTINFSPQQFLILDVVAAAIDKISEEARSKGISITLNVPDNLLVFADMTMVISIVRNLVLNGIKYSRRGGQVDISAKLVSQGEVLITVSDTGIGIKRDILNKLFKITELIKTQGTEGEPSSGLGLLISRELIQKNRGHLWIETEVNKGTHVFFTLPAPIYES